MQTKCNNALLNIFKKNKKTNDIPDKPMLPAGYFVERCKHNKILYFTANIFRFRIVLCNENFDRWKHKKTINKLIDLSDKLLNIARKNRIYNKEIADYLDYKVNIFPITARRYKGTKLVSKSIIKWEQIHFFIKAAEKFARSELKEKITNKVKNRKNLAKNTIHI